MPCFTLGQFQSDFSPMENPPSRILRQQSRATSYNENLMDEIIDKHLGGERCKKRKTINMEKEVDIEAMIAHSVGFPMDSLTEEEIEAGIVTTLGGTEQATYIVVRNHIVARWRENVHAWLSKEHIMESIRSEHKSIVNSAYNFLLMHGYINFGVAPAIKAGMPEEATKANVVIIGAGLAGLAAARQLLSFGFKVVIVEGRNRPGGRVYTRKMEGGGQIAAVDLGGSVITGVHGNPLCVLARQLSFPLHKVRDKCPLYQPDGKPVDAEIDSKVEDLFNKLLDKAGQLRQIMGELAVDISLGASLETFRQVYGVAGKIEERCLLNWHFANLEYANAGLLSELSLAFWDQDDPYEMGGDHCLLAGGNCRLIQAMTENVPIFYEKTVCEIRYGSDGVQVLAGGQVFQGDMALCTVPLGVLKSGSIRFIPELPKRKIDAIKRLGFGLLDKVAMLFPHVFWDAELDTFGRLCEDTSRRGEFFLFYSYASVSGGPLLIALVAGEAAIRFESMHPTNTLHRVLHILRGIYGPRGVDVPDPIQTVCTRWGSDPLCLGSYSHVAVGASGSDYDILAESAGDGRIFFAGEATNRRYPATMHGAFLSGLREAANISNVANSRSMPINVERGLFKDSESYATLLADLFREPDLEFGKFSVLFDPRSTDFKSMALLRVVVGGTRRKASDNAKAVHQHSNKLVPQQLQLYTLVSQQQAFELREVRGGDEHRLAYLLEKFGVKLAGRRGLGSLGDALVASIKCARAGRRADFILATPYIKFHVFWHMWRYFVCIKDIIYMHMDTGWMLTDGQLLLCKHLIFSVADFVQNYRRVEMLTHDSESALLLLRLPSNHFSKATKCVNTIGRCMQVTSIYLKSIQAGHPQNIIKGIIENSDKFARKSLVEAFIGTESFTVCFVTGEIFMASIRTLLVCTSGMQDYLHYPDGTPRENITSSHMGSTLYDLWEERKWGGCFWKTSSGLDVNLILVSFAFLQSITAEHMGVQDTQQYTWVDKCKLITTGKGSSDAFLAPRDLSPRTSSMWATFSWVNDSEIQHDVPQNILCFDMLDSLPQDMLDNIFTQILKGGKSIDTITAHDNLDCPAEVDVNSSK
eukprot:Gb_40551 [translate_table: standard]